MKGCLALILCVTVLMAGRVTAGKQTRDLILLHVVRQIYYGSYDFVAVL